jgi:hypothetical protein
MRPNVYQVVTYSYSSASPCPRIGAGAENLRLTPNRRSWPGRKTVDLDLGLAFVFSHLDSFSDCAKCRSEDGAPVSGEGEGSRTISPPGGRLMGILGVHEGVERQRG